MSGAILEIRCYTDPHCATCWGMEPVLRKLSEVYAGRIRLRPVMGGLVREMRRVDDPAEGDALPAQTVFARRWADACRKRRMPLDTGIFRMIGRDAFSSYPACLAQSAAWLMDHDAARIYLRRLREAFAVDRRDIQVLRVQIALAVDCGLGRDRFIATVQDGQAKRAFLEDRRELVNRGISALPAYLLRCDGREILLTGHTPFEAFADAAADLMGAPPRPAPMNATRQEIYNFIARCGRAAPVEVETVFDVDADYVRGVLEELERRGLITATPVGEESLYGLSLETG